MRTTRITFALLAALAALAAAAFAATPASAAEFVGSGTFPLKLKGQAVGPQEFNFNKIHIVCQKANVKGSLESSPTKTLPLVVTYKECVTGPIRVFGKETTVPMNMKEKAEYSFFSNGSVEESEEIEMRAKFVKCMVSWFPGFYPPSAEEKPEKEFTAAVYSNLEVPNGNAKKFPLGVQHKLSISYEFKNLEWSEEGGGVCEDEDIELLEGEHGKAKGTLEVEATGGNLEFA